MKLSEEVLMIRDAAADHAATRLGPGAHDRDQAAHLDRAEFAGLSELGLFGIALPESAGGVGAGPTAVALAVEELASRCPSTALAFHHHALLATELLAGAGRGELPALLSGELLATCAIGADLRAESRGAGVALTGRVAVVPGLASADLIVVQAGPAGYYVVERTARGVSIDDGARPLGMRAAGIADLELTGAAGERLEGPDPAPVLLRARLALGALAVGIGRGALECARTYARERTQFGRPLATFGAIRGYLAEMAVAVESARRLVLFAASTIEEGGDAPLAVAQAKFLAAESAVRVSDRAVQIHGGYGYVAEYPAERFYRDAQVPRSILTTDDAERARIADLILA